MPESRVASAKLIAAPLTRRRVVQGAAAAGGLAGAAGTMRPGTALAFAERMPVLSGNLFDLTLGPSAVNITGRNATATAFNASLPGPILRWREGDTVTLRVTNRLAETTSVHWHGIISTANMDGVPGLSFGGIHPGETFVFRIPVRQSGTYWYHSHSMYQEQTGAYGPIVIEPRAGYPQRFDRDYVVQLSDWSDTSPARIVSNLKMQSGYYNFHQRTVGSFVAEARDKGLGATIVDRLAWGRMRMVCVGNSCAHRRGARRYAGDGEVGHARPHGFDRPSTACLPIWTGRVGTLETPSTPQRGVNRLTHPACSA